MLLGSSPLASTSIATSGGASVTFYTCNTPTLLVSCFFTKPTQDHALSFAPIMLFSGYSSDGVTLTIPIDALVGLSISEAHAVTGSWPDLLQSILLSVHRYLGAMRSTLRPQTVDSALFEDWNYTHPEFSRCLKRNFYSRLSIAYKSSHVADEAE